MNFKKATLILILISIVSLFSFQDRFFEIAKQIEIYNNLFKTLNIEYIDEINPGELTKKTINNTLKNLDPYTRFYDEQQVEDVKIKREGEYAGIGISTWYSKKGIIVYEVKKDCPADKAGIIAGDLITNVNNQNLENMERDQLSQVLKGTPNTPISLSLIRNGKVKKFNLKLDKININPVPFYNLIDQETGYIKLNRFVNKKATEEVKKAFLDLENKGMKRLILDLRNNPGGSLGDAVNITNLFIEKNKTVVDTRGKIKRNSKRYTTKNLPLSGSIPLVVLINDKSASASEIVSGALQDYDRAVIIGQRSFGKGLVQRYFKLNYGTQMKATISKYYTPSGRCIQELDYANRDSKTGDVPKFSEGPVNAFKTTNGRTVYDGGGVTPDIKINYSVKTEETKKLLKSKAIFNFATNYLQKNKIISENDFNFNSSDFEKFKNYLMTKDTSFVSNEEKLFKKAFDQSKKTGINITSSFNTLQKKLGLFKIKQIEKNKELIIEKIKDQILRQKFYENGVYTYHLKNDKTIREAISILKDTNKYNRILNVKP